MFVATHSDSVMAKYQVHVDLGVVHFTIFHGLLEMVASWRPCLRGRRGPTQWCGTWATAPPGSSSGSTRSTSSLTPVCIASFLKGICRHLCHCRANVKINFHEWVFGFILCVFPMFWNLFFFYYYKKYNTSLFMRVKRNESFLCCLHLKYMFFRKKILFIGRELSPPKCLSNFEQVLPPFF